MSATLLKNNLALKPLTPFVSILHSAFQLNVLYRMRYSVILIAIVLSVLGCKKPDEQVFTNNTVPTYTGTPTLLVENYVNRLYIDLIGREPNDAEMNGDVQALEAAALSEGARTNLVNKLMNGTEFVPGDTSYAHAYNQKFYNDNKARFLEGAAENIIIGEYFMYRNNAVQDSMNGFMLAYELQMTEANKIKDLYLSKRDLREGTINVVEMCKRMSFNSIYDEINMGSFNYINSCFDNMLYRYPTDAELEMCEPAVESSLGGQLFGIIISNKAEFLNAILLSEEFHEGMIRWVYLSLLSREPTSAEVYTLMNSFMLTKDLKVIQRRILISSEYAGF